jgi:hypothetical protein
MEPWYAEPEWWLVILGFPMLFFIGWQAWETRRVSQSARDAVIETGKSAEAALLNAKAVINAERAWVVAELHPLSRRDEDGQWFGYDGKRLTTEETLAARHMAYSLRIRNMGRTPAQILSYQMAYSCLPEGVTDLDPNATPNIIGTYEFNHFLADRDPIEILPPFNARNYLMDAWDEIEQLKKTGVFHGWVKYRHMFSPEEFLSKYCYVYTPSLKKLTMVGRHTKYG